MPGWNKLAEPFQAVQPYSRIYLILIDDRNRTIPLPRDDNGHLIMTPRQRRYESIYKLFSHHVRNCGRRRIRVLRYGPGTTQQDINGDLQRELSNKRRGDQVFVYFSGGQDHEGAGYEGSEYSFRIAGFPRDEVNAWQLIEIAASSTTDVTFFLDCYCPTRFAYSLKQDINNVEVIASPAPKQDPSGAIIAGPGDFTRALVRTLKAMTDRNGRFKRYKARRSVCELTIGDGQMYSNFVRPLWFGRTAFEDEEIVARAKIDPRPSLQAGQVVFVQERIQGPGDNVYPAPVRKIEAAAFERGRQAVLNDQAQDAGQMNDQDQEDEGYAEGAGGHEGRDGLDGDADDNDGDDEEDNLFVSEDEADIDDEEDNA
ncbi:hypothetical protein LTR78_003625 [Recurvomyces mirabilis]|uniref:Uncharacterized protein n=1 Tax=Recurvomyces mirabilis TaxID=574656 RepID=A0AAE0WR22_9PEZI|nr:hypothetical protein LTR78_003625 [Recurvomyces mirabilis]KAK5154739.1 hypothetical protein LTS14_006318 [Recurvomyces mirabilis]